jgi:hypothetical protein
VEEEVRKSISIGNPFCQTGHCMSVGFPVQSSLPLINSSVSFTKMKPAKNVIVLKTTNSQTVVLQGDFQLIKLKGFCLVVYRSFKRSRPSILRAGCRRIGEPVGTSF